MARAVSFSNAEKKIICDLVEENKAVVENKRSDAASCGLKKKTWAAITAQYNSNRDVVKRDDKQLKRCWEKLKAESKKQKALEMRHRMGTGGGPPLRFVEDPILAQVDTIVPHLDIVIEGTFDSDYHHLVATSTPHPSIPDPSSSPTHSSTSLSPSSPFFPSTPFTSSSSSTIPASQPTCSLSTPVTSSSTIPASLPTFSLSTPVTSSSSSTIPACRPSFSLAASATATSSGIASHPPSSKSSHPHKKAKTTISLVEKELEARLAMLEEERLQHLELHHSQMKLQERMMKQSQMKDIILAENLRQAVAERELAEARLAAFQPGLQGKPHPHT